MRCWKNKRANGKSKYEVKYDHAVPAKVVLDSIFKNKNNSEEIEKILMKTRFIRNTD